MSEIEIADRMEGTVFDEQSSNLSSSQIPLNRSNKDEFNDSHEISANEIVNIERIALENERITKRSNAMNASINLMNAIIGSGVLGLPYAFYHSGFYLGLLLLIITAIICDKCIIMLVENAIKQKCMNYEQLMDKCFGNKGFYVVCTFIAISQFFTLTAYDV